MNMTPYRKTQTAEKLMLALVIICALIFLVYFMCSVLLPGHDLRGGYISDLTPASTEEKLRSLLGIEAEPEKDESGLLNINLAFEEELMTLPGINRTLAENIVLYRHYNGNYKSVDDLMRVTGMGEKTFSKICGLVTVTGGIDHKKKE